MDIILHLGPWSGTHSDRTSTSQLRWLTHEQTVRTYEGCQYYARQTRLPAQALLMIPITWLFMV